MGLAISSGAVTNAEKPPRRVFMMQTKNDPNSRSSGHILIKEVKEADPNSPKHTNKVAEGVDDDGNKFVNEYAIIRTLGKGSYGKVKLCQDSQGRAYAVKIMNKSILRKIKKGDSDAFQDVGREIAILKRLRHPNIVRLYEVIDDPENDKLFLVMEYMPGGPLMKIGSDLVSKKTLSEEKARKYVHDIIHGVEYLHSQKIIHRDIKPENLLLDDNDHVKVTDFGVSKMFAGEDDKVKQTAGTPAFLSPEACTGEVFSGKAADVWAIGVTIYVLVVGKCPFVGESYLEIYNNIQHQHPAIPDYLSEPLKDLFAKIFDKNPNTRITIPQIKEHIWYSTIQSDEIPISPISANVNNETNIEAANVSNADVENAIVELGTEKLIDHFVMWANVKSKLHQKAEKIRQKSINKGSINSSVSSNNEHNDQQQQQQPTPTPN